MTLSIHVVSRFMPVLGVLGLLATMSPVHADPAPAPSSSFADVDPMIGTGPDGHTFPGATVPFGMVQLSPDTWIGDFHHSYSHAAGYRYEDPTIQGFSHTHFSGTGHSDLGDVLVMPVAGAVPLEPGDPDKPGSGYRSRFSHDSEHAEPGYYAVTLSDSGVHAELTATARVGMHRYRFPEDKPAHLLIDLRQSIYNYPGNRYRGPDNAVHRARGFDFVSSFSLWDTYRAEQPLMTLIQHGRRTLDVVDSLIASREESPFGILRIWQVQGQETWCMIGYHAVPEIADAILKGIPGIDRNRALAAMVASATYAPYGHLGDYMKLGFVPVDHDDEAVSKTMEYAFDDWTIARTARVTGHAAIADTFDKRARNWRNVFDPGIGFVRPKLADGRFRDNFDPARAGAGSGFTEGDAWQYSWYQPQDVGGLIGLLGGDDHLVAKLDGMFDAPIAPHQYDAVEDMSGLIGQYVHGNEPSHHLAYLYAYAGQPWRGQARLKQIVDSQYRPAPDGLVGNDDLGQMSAWMIFTALGFYPVAPGSNQYVIGRPFVERAVLHLPSGRRFTVITEGLSDAHPYVGRVFLDGAPLSRSFLRHEEIMRGGTLRFVMQKMPNKDWATATQDRPFSTTPHGG